MVSGATQTDTKETNSAVTQTKAMEVRNDSCQTINDSELKSTQTTHFVGLLLDPKNCGTQTK